MSWKIILVLLFIWSNFANSALMISPTRVVFDDRQRTAQLVIINTTDKVRSYRLEWLDQVMNSDGSLRQILPPESLETSIKRMVRVSPKQVSLAPGERQVVKIALRKPKELEQKEYRSYLHFKALPVVEEKDEEKFGIKINMILSYSVPVIVRNITVEPTIKITNHSVIENNKKAAIAFEFERTEGRSTFGIIEVFFRPKGSQEASRVGILNDVAFYPDTSQKFVTIPLLDSSVLLKEGQFEVTYKGKKEYKDKLFAEKKFFFSPQDIIKP